jgi:hypothetical protein
MNFQHKAGAAAAPPTWQSTLCVIFAPSGAVSSAVAASIAAEFASTQSDDQ